MKASTLLKVLCVVLNWYFSIMLGFRACAEQSLAMLVTSQLWILAVLIVFPLFRKVKVPDED
jgi:hypothetical protein